MIEIAVVILNWNGENYLMRFLPGVIKHSSGKNIKIFVADNGSVDNSVNLLRTRFPKVKLILLDKNYGFAEGYNRALNNINAQYYILLNSDIEVTKGWIDPLIKMLDKKDNAAIVMPKIKAYNNKEYFEYAGAAGGFIDKLGYPFCRGRILNDIEKDTGQYDQEQEIFWATGACMCIRADIFHKSGGFDSYMFAHMEEIDLCWRLKNRGYNILYTPHSTIYHVGGGTLPNEHPRKLYLNFRNNLILLYKNLPKNKVLPIIALRLILDGVAAFKFLLGLKFLYFAAVLKAHIHFYSAIKKYNKIRKSDKLEINDYPSKVLRNSIIIQFYLKHKRRFTDLKFND